MIVPLKDLAPVSETRERSKKVAFEARDAKQIAAGRNVRATHGATRATVLGAKANAPGALVLDLDGRQLKAKRDGNGEWAIEGSFPKYEQAKAEGIRNFLDSNPYQYGAALMLASMYKEPSRPLHDLTLSEVNALLGEVGQALSQNKVKGDDRRFLKHLRSALEAALETPALASAKKTAALAHPLLGDCSVKLAIAGRSFSVAVKDGELTDRNFGGAEKQLALLLALQQSTCLRPEEQAHLLAQVLPKVETLKGGAKQIELKGSYTSTKIKVHPDLSIETKTSKEGAAWTATVGPAQALLLIAALERSDPGVAKGLRGKLFQAWTGKEGKNQEIPVRWYGGYLNEPKKAFIGVSVQENYRELTNFTAGGYQPYRWSDMEWDTSNGGSAYSMIAMAEVARAYGRSIVDEIRPVLDIDTTGVGQWPHRRTSPTLSCVLKDLRGETNSYKGRISGAGKAVHQWVPGNYAPSGYAYSKEGYREPYEALYCAFLAVRPYLAKELGWGPLEAEAKITRKDGEVEFRTNPPPEGQ